MFKLSLKKPFTIHVVIRSSFIGKRFVKGDVFKIKNYDLFKNAPPIIYRDIDDQMFMSIKGDFYWKSEVDLVETRSLWSRIVWAFQ